jgi:hypothetical protein
MSPTNLSIEPVSLSSTEGKFLVKQVLTDPLGLNKPALPSTYAIVRGDASDANEKRGGWTGVYAHSERSIAIYAASPVYAGYFDGDVGFAGNVEIIGDLTHKSGVANFANASLANLAVSGDIIMANADCAEDFDVDQQSPGEPGTVMVVGDAGVLQPGRQAYDKRVAGVISGAGDFKPGMVFDKRQSQSSRQPIALLGKVYCKVDAHYASIEVGDLLTTSCTLGHAMKAIEPLKAFGAVIGKALQPLRDGSGLIPILIALQ